MLKLTSNQSKVLAIVRDLFPNASLGGSASLAVHHLLKREIGDLDFDIEDIEQVYKYFNADYGEEYDENKQHARVNIQGVEVCFFKRSGSWSGVSDSIKVNGVGVSLPENTINAKFSFILNNFVEGRDPTKVQKHVDDLKVIFGGSYKTILRQYMLAPNKNIDYELDSRRYW